MPVQKGAVKLAILAQASLVAAALMGPVFLEGTGERATRNRPWSSDKSKSRGDQREAARQREA